MAIDCHNYVNVELILTPVSEIKWNLFVIHWRGVELFCEKCSIKMLLKNTVFYPQYVHCTIVVDKADSCPLATLPLRPRPHLAHQPLCHWFDPTFGFVLYCSRTTPLQCVALLHVWFFNLLHTKSIISLCWCKIYALMHWAYMEKHKQRMHNIFFVTATENSQTGSDSEMQV